MGSRKTRAKRKYPAGEVY